MNVLLISLFIVLAAYLLGSIPFAVIFSRLFGLADPRSYGSKNPGATNVLRSGNKAAATMTLLGDFAKGWLAVFLTKKYGLAHLGLGEGTLALVAIAVFFGHLFPIFLKFKGGKGVATAAGVLLAINPWLGISTLAIWLLTIFLFRYSSLAALTAATLAPILTFFLRGADEISLAVLILALALIAKHWANLQRLIAGNEPKIGGEKSNPTP